MLLDAFFDWIGSGGPQANSPFGQIAEVMTIAARLVTAGKVKTRTLCKIKSQ